MKHPSQPILLEALAARTFLMPVYGKKEKNQKPWQLNAVDIVSDQSKDLKALSMVTPLRWNQSRALSRYIAPNILNTETYADWIRQIVKKMDWLQIHSKED